MSDAYGTITDVDAQHATIAEAFGRDLDPLAEFSSTFEVTDVDPFEMFIADVIDNRDIADHTHWQYEIAFDQWREHMDREGRHPACPNETHVKAFARYELDEKENHPSTVKEKLRKLNEAYEYWQNEPGFPHPQDYNPIAVASSKIDLSKPDSKELPRIPFDELRTIVGDVTHVRDRAIIVTQLKLGLRAGELSNLKLSEVSIRNSELNKHYPSLGSHPLLEERDNAIYIPHNRDGNKRKRPTTLPLDRELRRLLLRYLLWRPNNGEPWVFLSKNRHSKLSNAGISGVWKDAFHPRYAETDRHRPVNSHYGRHYFTTFWTVEEELNRELVKYMRGDVAGASFDEGRSGIDHYIHTYYEDIDEFYRDRIYRFNLS